MERNSRRSSTHCLTSALRTRRRWCSTKIRATAFCGARMPNTRRCWALRQPPYSKWEWKSLGVAIGGPQLICLPDGRLVAAGRLYEGGPHTSLAGSIHQRANLSEFLKLPSGGDTSYAGLVMHDGLLWVSYYSTHEGKTSIYLCESSVTEGIRRSMTCFRRIDRIAESLPGQPSDGLARAASFKKPTAGLTPVGRLL